MTKIRISDIIEMKQKGIKISALTAYDYTFAYLLDEAGIDLVLVGDSCGNVCAGYETTLPVTMGEMLYHVRSVKRGVQNALLVADMPFMSYQHSSRVALENAGRLMKQGGAEAVKVEGGQPIINTVRKIIQAGIPVMGHLGFTPQSVHAFGGYRLRGKQKEEAELIMEDAQALEAAGIFALVLEKVPASLAKKITAQLKIPTIGIGAGRDCDGQILVTYDMLGLYDRLQLKFVRQYANLAEDIREAVNKYCQDIKQGDFPGEQESYNK